MEEESVGSEPGQTGERPRARGRAELGTGVHTSNPCTRVVEAGQLKTRLIQSLKLWSESPLGSHSECGR